MRAKIGMPSSYSITSVAVAINAGGTVRPNALAALKIDHHAVLSWRLHRQIGPEPFETRKANAGVAVEARRAQAAAQQAHRGGRSDRVRSCLQDGPRRHRVQAHGLALPLEPLGGLAPEQEPGLRCSEGRAGGKLATASAFGDFRDVLNRPRATRWTRKLKAASSIIA